MRVLLKLLVLLLALAVIPLAALALLDRGSMARQGLEFAATAREALLRRTADDLARLLRVHSERMTLHRLRLERIVRAQKLEVEERLRKPGERRRVRIFFAEDFDREDPAIPDLHMSERHCVRAADGTGRSLPVSYTDQAVYLAPGTRREDVWPDLEALADMSTAYRLLREARPEGITWQYTTLASGLHMSFPGHGGYAADFDPRSTDWYVATERIRDLTWTGPYVDASSGELVLTCSVPVQGADGSIIGVTGLDVTLADLVARMEPEALWEGNASCMLIRAEPRLRVLLRPGDRLPRQTPEWVDTTDAEAVRAVGADLAANRAGWRRVPVDGTATLWVYAPLEFSGMHLVVVLPLAEVSGPADAIYDQALHRMDAQVRTAGYAALVVLGLVVAGAIVGSRSVTKRLRELAGAVDRIARGDFGVHVDARSTDEVGELARHVNAVGPRLAEHLHMRQSLDLAEHVQQHMFPEEPPVVPGLDIAGRSLACERTGGDYFDYLVLPEGRIGLAVGDVVGHGVAAALLMTTVRALLRSHAASGDDPARVMAEVNRAVVPDMEAGQFVTLLYLVLSPAAKTVRWCSAGHNAALVHDPRAGTFTELEGHPNLPLGLSAETTYRADGPLHIGEGQVILAATDGIWESRDTEGRFFGDDAIRHAVRAHGGESAAAIVDAVLAAEGRHRGLSRPQQDDITLVVAKVGG